MKLKYNLQYFAADGKVTTGFSKPYVAKYLSNAGQISFTGGRKLARGVNVDLNPESSTDNNFHADNQVAESASGLFTGGTVTLTVDGLFMDAERFIQGLPQADAAGWVGYGDDKETPNIAIGYIVRYMSGGVTTYVPTILPKTKFGLFNQSAATQQEEIDWQTQEITATIMRADDANHNWKFISETEYATEDEAERALQTKLGIYVTDPYLEPVSDGVTLFGTLVSDIQSDLVIGNNTITGTLKYLQGGEIAGYWGDGNFMAIQFNNIDPRATSVRVGMQPSEGSGLVELINDPDKNGVFKVTDKDAQKFVVITSDGTHTSTATYDLKGLTCEGE